MSELTVNMVGGLRSSSAGTAEPLKLNVYDLTQANGYMYWVGLGIYHSAVEAYGMEYAFGAHDYPTSGVFEVEPRQCPGFTFRKSITLGFLYIGPETFREFIEEMACDYTGDSYHLITRNCNHFCDDVCTRLIGSSIPGWVNRLAKLGSLCSCFLPDSLEADAVRCTPEYQAYEDKAKCSRSTYSRLASTLAMVVPKKRHLTVSSAFFQSSFKGGISSWDWKGSNLHKERLRKI